MPTVLEVPRGTYRLYLSNQGGNGGPSPKMPMLLECTYHLMIVIQTSLLCSESFADIGDKNPNSVQMWSVAASFLTYLLWLSQ